MTQKYVYINVRMDYMNPNPTLVESLAALPGVEECRSMYPDDPALSNILLVVVEPDNAEALLDTIRSCDDVEFAEFTTRPVPR